MAATIDAFEVDTDLSELFLPSVSDPLAVYITGLDHTQENKAAFAHYVVDGFDTAESLTDFSMVTAVSLDPRATAWLAQADKKLDGMALLPNFLPRTVAHGLLDYAEKRPDDAEDAAEVWTNVVHKFTDEANLDRSMKKIVVAGMRGVFRRELGFIRNGASAPQNAREIDDIRTPENAREIAADLGDKVIYVANRGIRKSPTTVLC